MILVTGVTGFVGRNLAKKLIAEKIDFCCLIRNKNKKFLNYLRKNKVKLYEGSLGDKKALDRATKSIKVVIHLAAIISSPSPLEIMKINFEGTKNLVDSCVKNKVNKIVFLSSYLAKPRFIRLKNFYAKSKFESEKYIKKSGLDFTIIKSSVIYGKDDSKNVSKIISLVKKGPFVPIVGDGNYKLQLIYIDDILGLIVKCLKSNKTHKKVYYAAGEEVLTYNQLVKLISKKLNLKRFLIHIPLPLMKSLVKVLAFFNISLPISLDQLSIITENKTCDISKTKKELSFNPLSFEEGLKQLLKYGLSHDYITTK